MNKIRHLSLSRQTIIACLALFTLLSGCSSMSSVQLAGTAIGLVLEATGVIKKDSGDPSRRTTDLSLRIFGGERLNTTSNGESMSLVVKVYVLRSPERLRTLTDQQITSLESEREAMGEDLISVREITVIPGKNYDMVLKVPGDANAIGVVGMFRAPYFSRWKLAFDAKRSIDTGIIVGAHACALSTSRGGLLTDISPLSMQSLVGVQCNT